MSSPRRVLLLATLSLAAVSSFAVRGQSEEYECQRGDLVRRIEVQFADDADRLPCQVLYWSDAESSEPPRAPWNAERDLEFCTGKARQMADRLRSAGWTCEGHSPLPEDAAELVAPAASEPPSRESVAADAPLPSPPRDAVNGRSRPDQATLQAALTRDLRRLDELGGASSGGFEANMATLGDLDGDGVEDGAALLSHSDANGGSSYHLLAYLFDGSTFWPVARVNLEAYYQNLAVVAIQEITKSGIELLLQTPRAGDPACCPTGRRRATFALRDGQLVLAAESESGA